MYDKRLEIMERCRTPRGDIQLQRRGADYEIISNGTFLMATYNGDSEKWLVRAALEACENESCSVLIGGLGVGYSLAEAVSSPRTGQVTVIEIEPKVIEWNRLYLSVYSGDAIRHRKTRTIQADLLEWVKQTDETFDVICLDIDNGPDWVVFEENKGLYDDKGLAALARMLNPGGVVSFWSASPAPAFMERLNVHFSEVEAAAIDRDRTDHPDYVYISKAK